MRKHRSYFFAKGQVSRQGDYYFLGANNLFDQQPDIASSNYPITYVGRYMYAGAKITM